MLRFGCATVFLVGLGACGGDGGDDPVTASARDVCLQMTNQFRADNGKLAVVHAAALEAYADEGAA